VRRALATRTAGHTGTLDPFATGLLVVLVGRATRLARFVESADKTYLGVARLGVRTATDDRTGPPIGEPTDVSGVSEASVREALLALRGSMLQRPPAYSAKWVAGERSYRLARRGRPVELADVPITVHRIQPLEWRPPDVTFRATVSAGTYLRAIARDLGDALGVGGHLVSLRREAIGGLRVEDATPLDRLGPNTPLVPLTRILAHLPVVELDAASRTDVRHGRAVAAPTDAGDVVSLLAEGQVVAIARVEGDQLRPVVVLEDP
jgi:tRNA pseudouridine55 synthase